MAYVDSIDFWQYKVDVEEYNVPCKIGISLNNFLFRSSIILNKFDWINEYM